MAQPVPSTIDRIISKYGGFRPLEGLDIVVVPGLLQQLGGDPKELQASLEAEYPVRRAGEPIVPRTVQWVEGTNEALKYRGNVLNRTKIWLQRGDPRQVGTPYYYYTGVQWEVVLAQTGWDECPPVRRLVAPMDAFCEAVGAKVPNAVIATAYRDETCGIGKHFDKPKSIAASDDAGSSLITVFKTGDVGRPFELYLLGEEEKPTWSQVVPPGSAIIMTLEANLKTKHAVPTLDKPCGNSGSLVWRTISTVLSVDEVQKKVEASRRQKKRAREG